MALSPHPNDPNRDAQLAARRENPAAFNVRPSAEVQAAARRLNVSVEQYLEQHGHMTREQHDELFRDKRPDRKAKGSK